MIRFALETVGVDDLDSTDLKLAARLLRARFDVYRVHVLDLKGRPTDAPPLPLLWVPSQHRLGIAIGNDVVWTKAEGIRQAIEALLSDESVAEAQE
ncbi:MAG: hypothetical protein ACYC5O_23670 [Anaerolineae bacterium]